MDSRVTDADKAFTAWLLEHGAAFPKLQWPVWEWPGQPHDGERGVMATEDIAPGEEMFRIPGKILFNREKCLASPIAQVFKKHRRVLFSHPDQHALVLLLLYEKLENGRDSFWWPMIEALPADPGAASLWSEEELGLLQDPTLMADALLKTQAIQREYEEILLPILAQHAKHFPNAAKFTLGEFRWALLCVESRTFGRFLPNPSLVPFADLLNHVNVHTRYRWDAEAGAAVYHCDASGRVPHPRGAEAFMSYGPRSNRELLLHYGFALLDNMYDRLPIQIRLHSSDPSRAARNLSCEVQAAMPCLSLPLLLYRRSPSLKRRGITGSLPVADTEGCAAGFDVLPDVFVVALESAATALEATLAGAFATSSDQDSNALEEAAGHRTRFALIHRITRKHLLLAQVQFFRLLAARIKGAAASCPPSEEGGLIDASSLIVATFCEWSSSAAQGHGGRLVESEGGERGGGEAELRQGLLELVAQLRKKGEGPISAIGPLLLEPALNARETQSDAPSDARSIDARSIAVGPSYSAIVTGGGALLVFGSNTGGRLGLSQTEFDARAIQAEPLRIPALSGVSVTAVACGDSHMVCSAASGRVFAWGANGEGQCGFGFKSPQVLQCSLVADFGHVTSVAAGTAHTVAMTREGRVFCWGRNFEGQCGAGAGAGGAVLAPHEADTDGLRGEVGVTTMGTSVVPNGLFGVWAGGRQSAAAWGGRLCAWGCGGEGRLGLGDADRDTYVARVPHSLEKDVDGDVMCSAPRNVVFFVDETEGDEDVISVAIGYSLLLAVVRSGKGGKGTLWAAGLHPPIGLTSPAPSLRRIHLPSSPGGVRTVACSGAEPSAGQGGWTPVVVALEDGSVLHLSTDPASPGWSEIPGVTSCKAVAAGPSHTLSMEEGGRVWGWGSVEQGEVGVKLSTGFLLRALTARLAPTTSPPAVSAEVACVSCRCTGMGTMAFTSVDARGGGREKQGPDVLCAKCMAKGEHPIARAHVTVASHRRLPAGVVLQLPPGSDAAEGGSGAHEGVTCGHCGASPLLGARYKCGNCVSLDVCEACFASAVRGAHPSSHLFLRIPLPLGSSRLSEHVAEHARRGAPLLPLLFPAVTVDAADPA